MLDLQLLKTYLAVLETGTYSGAALQLDYAPSTVTKHMQLLESNYQGAKLLQRQGNRMLPTEQGEVLRRYAVQLIQLYEASQCEVTGAENRTLRIGTTYALSESYLPIAIRQIVKLHPNVNIHLTNGNPRILHDMLKSGQVDAMFIIDSRCRYDGFSVQCLREETMVVAIPPNPVLAEKKATCFDDIKKERFILTADGCSIRRYLLDEFSHHVQVPCIGMELDSINAIKQAVMHQQGIGFMPAILGSDSKELVYIPYTDGHEKVHSMIVYEKNGLCTPKLMKQIADAVLAHFPQKY